MFTFFHRKKKVVVDCFTSNPNAYNYAKIKRASKSIPEWWKNLKPIDSSNRTFRNEAGQIDLQSNMRKCYGFLELFKRGIVLESWTDFNLEIFQNNFDWHHTSGPAPVSHDRNQIGFGFANYHHLKLNSPWFFSEKTGLHFGFVGAEWNLENYNFKVLPGVIEFMVNKSTNVNIMIPRANQNSSYKIEILTSQPLVHIYPLNDDVEVEYKNHLVDHSFMSKTFTVGSTPSHYELIKIYEKNLGTKSKCPFGF